MVAKQKSGKIKKIKREKIKIKHIDYVNTPWLCFYERDSFDGTLSAAIFKRYFLDRDRVLFVPIPYHADLFDTIWKHRMHYRGFVKKIWFLGVAPHFVSIHNIRSEWGGEITIYDWKEEMAQFLTEYWDVFHLKNEMFVMRHDRINFIYIPKMITPMYVYHMLVTDKLNPILNRINTIEHTKSPKRKMIRIKIDREMDEIYTFVEENLNNIDAVANFIGKYLD